MILLNPKSYDPKHLDEGSAELMRKTIAFFEGKGKARLKKDDRERVWYEDFLGHVAREKIFAKLLTPAPYGGGDPAYRWDTARNCDFSEITAFYALHYWYTWQVTILGLGPIWMGTNEGAKARTAEALKAGGIFAFGLSERAHGADLYSTEMTLAPKGDGTWIARGSKYYIGNANEAATVSTFGKTTDTGEFVFFSANPRGPGYELVQNVVNVQSYVAEYRLHDHPITEADVLSRGEAAWDSALNTINVGKFNLGWASIGICTHAFYEAIHHAAHRVLYGKHVTDFPHVQKLFVDAYTRLVAMKAFARRAADYMRTASAEDRRYLLFNPMVKMKVTTQGEQVVDLLWDVIAAKGFEKDTYFEIATRDIRALPKLEGTVHVNMALVVKFMKNYFFAPATFPEIPAVYEAKNDDFLFHQGATKGLGKIQFHDYQIAYGKVTSPNVSVFKEQIDVWKEFLVASATDVEAASVQGKDIDFLLSLGEVFTLVAYGQLLLEYRELHPDELSADLLEQIFDFMVRDFSRYALQLFAKPSSTPRQMELCQKMIRRPPTDTARFERIWAEVHALRDAYEMSPLVGRAAVFALCPVRKRERVQTMEPQTMSDEIVFYHNPMSRGRIVHWMLEEVGAPYRIELLSFEKGEHKTPAYMALNPMGKIPTIVHRGTVVTEAAAICTYLADAFPAAGLAPAIGDPARGSYLRWLFFGAGCIEPAISDRMFPRTGNERPGAIGYGTYADVVRVLEQALTPGPCLLGDRFSAADVYVGSALGWGMMTKAIDPSPVFQAYVACNAERPAFKRMVEQGNALAAKLKAG